MANSHAFTAEENGDVPAATRVEAAPHEEDASTELASASPDGISQATERSQEEDAAAKLAAASRNEKDDANEHNPQAEIGVAELESGSVNGRFQDEAAAEPVSSSMDPSSDVSKDTPQEEDAAPFHKGASTYKIPDTIKNAHVDVLAKGIATVLGPVMNDFDGGVESAFKSQSILACSIDRLTRELDKLLEDVPLQYVTQHATRLSGIRQRILSLTSTLRIIQRRMDTIERFRAGYALKAIVTNKREKASKEKSHSQALSLSPSKGTSSVSADGKKNDGGGQLSKVAGAEISNEFGNNSLGGSQDDNAQEESVSKNLNAETSNQEPDDLRRALDGIDQ